MRRREFITLLGGAAAAWPQKAHAQTPEMFRIGIVSAILPRTAYFWVAFDQRMRELGYVEGQNLTVDFTNLNGQIDRYGEAMKELIGRKVHVILAPGNEIAIKSAQEASKTLPIVMVAIDFDPLARGYVRSLARPGGNVTGLSAQQIELTVKRLELLKDALPNLRGVVVFWDRISFDQWQAAQSAAATLRLRLEGIEFSEPPFDYERRLAEAAPDRREAIVVLMSPVFFF